MIAPLREPNATAPHRHLSEARHYLATTWVDRPAEGHGPAVAPWKAWALVGWIIVVCGFYATSMLGWW